MPKKMKGMPINKKKTTRKAPAKSALLAPIMQGVTPAIGAMGGLTGGTAANSADIALQKLQKRTK